MLESVFVASGLNVWKPSFIKHRSYSHARYRIVEGTKKLRTSSGVSLSEFVYMAPFWDPSNKDDIDFEWQSFLQQISPSADGPRRGLIIGPVKAVQTKPGWTAPLLRLSDLPVSFWLDACPDLVPDTTSPDVNWAALIEVEHHPSHTGKLRVVDGAAIRMTRNWLPVASEIHASIALGLVDSRRSFVAPLLSDPDTSWAFPDFIVESADGSRCIAGPAGFRSCRQHAMVQG